MKMARIRDEGKGAGTEIKLIKECFCPSDCCFAYRLFARRYAFIMFSKFS